jgi:glycosyltransferase involved in cell wall biosynthesis
MWSVARVPLRMSAAVFDLRQWRAAWSAVSAPAAAAMQPTLGLAEISLLPNGVDRSFWQTPARVADSATVRLASVMRLSSRKRPRALLRMLATLRATVPARIRLEATIVGDGPLRSRLVSQAGALGLDGWVDFTGRLTRPQVRDVLAATDIYVAPAHLESFGIAALEARCAGLPIVGYRGTGIADFVDHGEHGLLASDDREMASALGTLAMDRALRERISERNRCEAPPATWSQVLAGCDELYERAVSLTRRDTAMDAWPADAPASLAAS